MRDVRLGKFGGMSGDLSGMSLWLAGEADAKSIVRRVTGNDPGGLGFQGDFGASWWALSQISG
jgi:hypothetical protein